MSYVVGISTMEGHILHVGGPELQVPQHDGSDQCEHAARHQAGHD